MYMMLAGMPIPIGSYVAYRQQHAVTFVEQAESACIKLIHVSMLIDTVHTS